MIRDLEGHTVVPPQPKWTTPMLHLQKWFEPAKASKAVTLRCNRFREPESVNWIPWFAKQYGIRPRDVEGCEHDEPAGCWTRFRSFNDFFTRVRTGLPRVTRIAQPTVVSPADAYTMYLTSQDVRDKVWIKGTHMSLDELFANRRVSPRDLQYHLFIFRLAPQHYHRFHSPVTGRIVALKRVGTEYFSVDPVVVRSRLNVYTRNVRVIVQMQTYTGSTFFLAIIGATCVGSIQLSLPALMKRFSEETGHAELNDHTLTERAHFFRKPVPIRMNEELGYFQYGGSTIVMSLPWEEFQWASSLRPVRTHSAQHIETEVSVGYPLLTFETE